MSGAQVATPEAALVVLLLLLIVMWLEALQICTAATTPVHRQTFLTGYSCSN